VKKIEKHFPKHILRKIFFEKYFSKNIIRNIFFEQIFFDKYFSTNIFGKYFTKNIFEKKIPPESGDELLIGFYTTIFFSQPCHAPAWRGCTHSAC